MQPMNGNSRWTILSLAALVMVIACALALAAGPPAGYQPGPFPDPNKPTMPLKGLGGSGMGYCVTIEGTELRINVPGHILDPLKRDEVNRRYTRIASGKLSTDPGFIVAEYRASVQNAFKLMASMSGDPRLIAAAQQRLVFPELGDIQLEGAKAPTTECKKSTCYGSGPGSGCVPIGCESGCADCVSIRVPSVQ